MGTMKFLEMLGQNPTVSQDDYLAVIGNLDVADEERQSLRGRDATKLASLLGGRAQMWCAIMAPDEAPSEEEEPDDEPNREPDQK